MFTPSSSASSPIAAHLRLEGVSISFTDRRCSPTCRSRSSPANGSSSSARTAPLEEAERLGAWQVDARVGAMLAGLGLGALVPQRPLTRISGGQRARLALAELLLRAHDVLLLDEPTNHLDDAATAHLRRVLRNWAVPVLLASHDRAFVDEMATSILDLDPAPGPRTPAAAVGHPGRLPAPRASLRRSSTPTGTRVSCLGASMTPGCG